ncbi:MAG TPA: hypothetical protein VFN60_00020 [Acidimicrobiales bacterium]|nr:hypothetical protein [Acidimicrobiales bacterium]
MTAPARRLLLGLLLVAAAGWVAPGQAAAAPVTGRRAGASLPVSDCTPSAGVLVAVDFGHWGGPVVRGCSGHAASAIAAMHAAGFLTAGDQANGAAFVCRIGVAAEGVASERPTPAADPCVATPPATAYWSFWYADAGRSRWSYSPSGAATFVPAAGSVEAWAFGAGAAPGVTPAALRSRPPATSTTTTPPSTSTTGPPPTAATTTAPAAPTTTAPTTARSSPATTGRSRSHRAASSTTTTATGPAAGATRTSATRPAASTTTRPTTTAAGTNGTSGTSPTTTRIVDAAAGGGSPGGGSPGGGPGSPAGLIAGAAVVVVLGGAGGVLAWRRRRAA